MSLSSEEKRRLEQLLHFEHVAYAAGFSNVAGVDEAGRGPLAGPVVAAACILPKGTLFPGLDDSKKLTPKVRQELFATLTTTPGVLSGIGIIDPEEIDRINIYQASLLAFKHALDALPTVPDYILVDGMALQYLSIPTKKIIKGDTLSLSIAAASVIAKVTRDRMMEEWDALWPAYGFKSHKGYGTKKHVDALKENGPCPIHRRSFEPVKSLVEIF